MSDKKDFVMPVSGWWPDDKGNVSLEYSFMALLMMHEQANDNKKLRISRQPDGRWK